MTNDAGRVEVRAVAQRPLLDLTSKKLERFLVHARIAGRDDAAAVLRGLSLPVRDYPAGPGDDRDQGRDVVRLQLGLDHQIEMAGCEHAVGIAVAAIARQPHRALDAAEDLAVAGVGHQRAGGADTASPWRAPSGCQKRL